MKPTPIICCASPTILFWTIISYTACCIVDGFHSQSSRLGMRTLGLVDRNRHTHGANGPAGHDATHQDHGQLHGGALQDGAYGGQQCAELDGRFSSKPIDGQTGCQGSDSGCWYCAILAMNLTVNTAKKADIPPPEKVLLIAPMIEDVLVVLKNSRKLGDAMTSVMTPTAHEESN